MSSSILINPFIEFPPAGGGFLPSDVAGLHIWHKANELALSDNDPVSSWTDESGNGNHSTASSTQRPVFKTGIVNGKAVVRFDGTNQYLDVVDLSALTEAEAFIVVKLDADPPAEAQSGLWGLGTDGTGTHFTYTDGNIYDSFGTTSRKTVGNPTPSFTSWRIYSVYSADSDWQAYVDGVSIFSTGTNTVGFPSFGLKLGSHTNASYKLDGDIAEFILYDHKLASGDRTDVWAYLETEYGL